MIEGPERHNEGGLSLKAIIISTESPTAFAQSLPTRKGFE